MGRVGLLARCGLVKTVVGIAKGLNHHCTELSHLHHCDVVLHEGNLFDANRGAKVYNKRRASAIARARNGTTWYYIQ